MEEWLGIELIDAYGLVVYKGVDKTILNMNYYYNKKNKMSVFKYEFTYI